MVSVFCCRSRYLLTPSSVDGYGCWSRSEGEETLGAREAASLIVQDRRENIFIFDCIDILL
jgi:hypothetical protein